MACSAALVWIRSSWIYETQLSLPLAVKRPEWLDGKRGRGVPETMNWVPGLTFLHVLVDAMNAMVVVPGEFKSFGHYYRADTADFVLHGLGFPKVTKEQREAVEANLIERELDRGSRINSPPPLAGDIQ